MIKLQVIGHLGRDAAQNNANGTPVINFAVAHTIAIKDPQGNKKDFTTWVDCAYWTDKVALLPFLKKGQQVYVEGIPNSLPYTTRDGKAASKLVLRVSNIQLVGIKKEDGYNSVNAATQPHIPSAAIPQAPLPNTPPDNFDDLPF